MKSFFAFFLVTIGLAGLVFIADNNSFLPSNLNPKDIDYVKERNIKQQESLQRYGETNYYYGTVDKLIYYKSGSRYQSIDGADPETFQKPASYSWEIARDKNYVYIKGERTTSVDATTLTRYIVDGQDKHFYKDKNGFYYFTRGYNYEYEFQPIPFDPRTAEFFDHYIKTADKVFTFNKEIREIPGADPATFRNIGTCSQVEMSWAGFTADKNHVYVGTYIVPNMDPTSLTSIGTISSGPDDEVPFTIYIWKDKDRIYSHCGRVIAEADYDTFEVVDNKTLRDKDNVYLPHTGGDYVAQPRTD